MIANTGTYLDSPFHRFGDREDLGMLPLDAVADLAGLVIDASSRRGRSIGPEVFAGYSLSRKAVLIKTLWDRHWRTPQYGAGHPYLTRAAVDLLVAASCDGWARFATSSMIPMMERGPRTHCSSKPAFRSSSISVDWTSYLKPDFDFIVHRQSSAALGAPVRAYAVVER